MQCVGRDLGGNRKPPAGISYDRDYLLMYFITNGIGVIFIPLFSIFSISIVSLIAIVYN